MNHYCQLPTTIYKNSSSRWTS